MMAFRPEHRKCDQNPKFTSLGETTSIPPLFIWDMYSTVQGPRSSFDVRLLASSICSKRSGSTNGISRKRGKGFTSIELSLNLTHSEKLFFNHITGTP